MEKKPIKQANPPKNSPQKKGFSKLPRELKDLDSSYKALIRELSKR